MIPNQRDSEKYLTIKSKFIKIKKTSMKKSKLNKMASSNKAYCHVVNST